MDLTNLLSNNQLLQDLAREFKELKLSKANIDYNIWMREKLRDIAAKQQPNAASDSTVKSGTTTAENLLSASFGSWSSRKRPTAPTQPVIPPVNNLDLSINRRASPGLRNTDSSWPAAGQQQAGQQQSQPPAIHIPGGGPVQQEFEMPADSLGTSAAQLLRAAAERERLWAMTQALAKQDVLLGVQPTKITDTRADTMQHNSAEEVLKVTQQLAAQQQDLLKLVQATQQQLGEHKDLISAALQGNTNPSKSATQTQEAFPADDTKPQVPKAWFIQESTPSVPSQTTATVRARVDSPLHVIRAVSPDGRPRVDKQHALLQTQQVDKQQRKEALKASLKQALADGNGDKLVDSLGLFRGASKQRHSRQTETKDTRKLNKATVRDVLQRLLPGLQQQDHSQLLHHQLQQQRQLSPDRPRQRHITHPLTSTTLHHHNIAANKSGHQPGSRHVHELDANDQPAGQTTSLPIEAYNSMPLHLRQQPDIEFGTTLPAGCIPSIEDEAAAIIQQDRAKAAEQARLERIEHVESQLSELMQQLRQYNADRMLGSQQRQSDAVQQHSTDTISYTLSHITATAQGQAAGAMQYGLQSQQQQQQQQQTSHVPDEENPILTLQRALNQLQKLEQQEAQVRQRWLGSGSVKTETQAGLLVDSGVVRTLPNKQHQAAPTNSTHDANNTPVEPSLGTTQQNESIHAVNPNFEPKPAIQGISQQESTTFVSPKQSPDPVSDDLVERVQEGRRQYLEYQQQLDGVLLGLTEPGSTQVPQLVESVAEALLNELLIQQAEEMLKVCDAVGEELFEKEFAAA